MKIEIRISEKSNRQPEYATVVIENVCAGPFFYPDDDPASIVNFGIGMKVFFAEKAQYLWRLRDEMFDSQGNKVYDAAYPVCMAVLRWPVNG